MPVTLGFDTTPKHPSFEVDIVLILTLKITYIVLSSKPAPFKTFHPSFHEE